MGDIPDSIADVVTVYAFLQAFPGYTAASMAAEDPEMVEGLLAILGGRNDGEATRARLRGVGGW